MVNQINVEIKKIKDNQEIIVKSLFEFACKYPNKLKYKKLKKIEIFLSDLVDGEIDYIIRNPKDYLKSLED
jgi:hypothetical protein